MPVTSPPASILRIPPKAVGPDDRTIITTSILCAHRDSTPTSALCASVGKRSTQPPRRLRDIGGGWESAQPGATAPQAGGRLLEHVCPVEAFFIVPRSVAGGFPADELLSRASRPGGCPALPNRTERAGRLKFLCWREAASLPRRSDFESVERNERSFSFRYTKILSFQYILVYH